MVRSLSRPFAPAHSRYGCTLPSRDRFLCFRVVADPLDGTRRGIFALVIALMLLAGQAVAPIRADDTKKPQRVARIEAGKSVEHVRFSPDGKLVAVVDAGQHLVMCDTDKRKVQAVFADVAGFSSNLCFTPDGESVVVTDHGRIRLVDATNGTSRELYKHDLEVGTPVFSRDGSLLAWGDDHGQVTVWDYKAGKEAGRFRCKGRVRHMVFMKDGTTLAVGGEFAVRKGDKEEGRYEVWVWDWKNKEIRATLEGIRHPGVGMALSPDGKTLATLGQRVNEVWLWDTRTNKRSDTYKIESAGVEALAYSADGRMLFAAGGGAHKSPGHVTVWDTSSGKRIASFEALNDIIKSLDVSADGKLMAISHLGSYGTFELWDISSLRKLVGKK
jgi:WD40 repeat protein